MAAGMFYAALAKIIYPKFRSKVQVLEGGNNLPKTGGYLLASNHVDWLDGFYIAAVIDKLRQVPVYFLTKSNNYWWTEVAIQIPDQKESIVEIAAEHMRQGRVITTFPEGERNNTSTLLTGKTGAVRSAVAAGVPIIPLGITCSAGRSMGQSLQYLFSHDHRVEIRIGQPLKFSSPGPELSHEWLQSETARLMAAIAPLAQKHI